MDKWMHNRKREDFDTDIKKNVEELKRYPWESYLCHGAV